MEGEKASIDAEIARAKARISEIKLQVIAIDEQARTEAQRELSVIDPKIAELNERRWAIEDRLSRTEIKAPISGTINELAVNTIGGVITPAETLVTIVPKDATLKIEARLAPTDIDQVYLGQSANLRFSTFNQRTTPELRGSVAFVSPATFADKATGQHYYLAEVEVSADELSKLDKKRLLPGMPVEVFMSTEPRTALSFFPSRSRISSRAHSGNSRGGFGASDRKVRSGFRMNPTRKQRLGASCPIPTSGDLL